MSRLILVSNRLPVTVKQEGKRVHVTPSTGGLATGLRGPHQRSGGLWIGWPGDTSRLSPDGLAQMERELSDLHCVPIQLSASEVARYYEGFSNEVLWPLFHFLLDRIPSGARDWESYRKVNERFADLVASHYQEGDLVWVHDYQLTLVPGFLRRRLPRAKIGFFLHIPFPPTDVFRVLPWREQVLEGMLGADLVGFHTYGFLRHFAKSVVRTLGSGFDIDRIHHRGRSVSLGVFPISIDYQAYQALAREPEVEAQAEQLRAQSSGQRVLLGIDRLDYTKGIGRRLLAIERLLEREPHLRGKVRFIQVAVPSRDKVEAYARFRREIEELVGRINGAYGTPSWVPIHYMYRACSERTVAALYRVADVMLVTPLRDGMNLVAKEFVAARVDGDGVLVLSEFAGAFAELGEALSVNPNDIDGMASAIKQALSMPEDERRTRMAALRARVERHDVHRWAGSFLSTLDEMPETPVVTDDGPSSRADIERLIERCRAARSLVLLLDYDGTLRPIVATPELAVPPKELKALLAALAARRGTEVHVVSGRTRESLEGWLGSLPIALYAEHGAWYRDAPSSNGGGGDAGWRMFREVRADWKDKLRPILEDFTDRTPGSRLEEKSVAIAWHYRMADAEFGPRQAKELAVHLADILSNAPVEVLQGDKVVEVRHQGMNKGLVVKHVLARAPADATVLAMGDDRTDEDLFAALPPGGIAVHVGAALSRARYRVAEPAGAHAILRALLE